jgi:hypothetical protein
LLFFSRTFVPISSNYDEILFFSFFLYEFIYQIYQNIHNTDIVYIPIIFIDFFQSVANLPGSKSNSKNIDPKFESSFARFFSNETIFNDFFQSLANFPAKGLLARGKGPHWKFVIFHGSFS